MNGKKIANGSAGSIQAIHDILASPNIKTFVFCLLNSYNPYV
jgi:hypothetical protein